MSNHTSITTHEGHIRCHTHFTGTNAEISTDVSPTNGGLGEKPAPTALLAASVASCMLSMLSVVAARKGLNTSGATISAACEEHQGTIQALNFHISLPCPTTEAERTLLTHAVQGCPVGKAIAPEIEKRITWAFKS